MILHRLAPGRYADDLSGEGSRLFGGRWTPAGRPVLHLSANFSISVLEVLSKLNVDCIMVPYFHVEVFVPDGVSQEKIEVADLPLDWNASPHEERLWPLGRDWLTRNEALLLFVPSAVVDGHDYNCLVNVSHPEFKHVKLHSKRSFAFDERFMEMIHSHSNVRKAKS